MPLMQPDGGPGAWWSRWCAASPALPVRLGFGPPRRRSVCASPCACDTRPKGRFDRVKGEAVIPKKLPSPMYLNEKSALWPKRCPHVCPHKRTRASASRGRKAGPHAPSSLTLSPRADTLPKPSLLRDAARGAAAGNVRFRPKADTQRQPATAATKAVVSPPAAHPFPSVAFASTKRISLRAGAD